uniref:Uncharacterized protein n=1 Tax=Trichogramma kaykai TaxID=54128 RepID=A0ABD2X6N7_9HYME
MALSLEFVIRRRTIVTRVPARETAVKKGSRGSSILCIFIAPEDIAAMRAWTVFITLLLGLTKPIKKHRLAFTLLAIASFYAGSARKIKFALPPDTGQTKYVRLPGIVHCHSIDHYVSKYNMYSTVICIL